MIQKVFLNYDFNIFLNADYSSHSGSCIKHQIHECTDVHEKYSDNSKMPETYKLSNTLIHQLWWDENTVDFEEIGCQINMTVKTISSICQPPGNIIPLHKDTFYKIKTENDVKDEYVVRANIYLEDWKPGQMLQVAEKDESNWINSHQWKAGEGFLLDEYNIHVGANAGMSNKYTLQVSGFLN